MKILSFYKTDFKFAFLVPESVYRSIFAIFWWCLKSYWHGVSSAWMIDEDIVILQNWLQICLSRPKVSPPFNFHDFLMMFDRFLTGGHWCVTYLWIINQEVIIFIICVQKWISRPKIIKDSLFIFLDFVCWRNQRFW